MNNGLPMACLGARVYAPSLYCPSSPVPCPPQALAAADPAAAVAAAAAAGLTELAPFRSDWPNISAFQVRGARGGRALLRGRASPGKRRRFCSFV